MPKYELMYIVGSHIADDEIPKTTDEVRKFIESNGGLIEKYEELGKKKLAYPMKKTKIGHYVVAAFSAPSDKVNEIEQRIRTTQSIIRHLIVNMDEATERMEKDRVIQSQMKRRLPQEAGSAGTEKPAAKPARKIEIDLDAEIEKALGDESIK